MAVLRQQRPFTGTLRLVGLTTSHQPGKPRREIHPPPEMAMRLQEAPGGSVEVGMEYTRFGGLGYGEEGFGGVWWGLVGFGGAWWGLVGRGWDRMGRDGVGTRWGGGGDGDGMGLCGVEWDLIG